MFEVLIALAAMAACLRIGHRIGRKRGVEDTVQNAIRVPVTQRVEQVGDTIVMGAPTASPVVMVLTSTRFERHGSHASSIITAEFQDQESYVRERTFHG